MFSVRTKYIISMKQKEQSIKGEKVIFSKKQKIQDREVWPHLSDCADFRNKWIVSAVQIILTIFSQNYFPY